MADLVVQNVTKHFGRQRVLDGVEFHVAAGTVTTLLGASGSGKTTLLRLLCGFERPDAGTIRLDGTLVAGPGTHLAPEHRGIGYVPQDGALFPHLSVAQNIVFGLPRRERSSRAPVDRLLALMGLPPAYGERRPHELSGGEQQRVALARALAATPRMVLLDEPFSSLDAALRVETRRAVSDAIAAVGATALLVTHDQAEALSMGGQVAVLRDGCMVQVDAPPTLYRRPVDLPLARFVGEAVVLPGEACGERVACALGSLRLALPAEGSVDVMLRPEQIRVHAPGDAGGIPATVAGVVFYGHDASITAALDEASGVTVTVRTPGHVPIEAGDRVRLSVAGEVMGYPCPAGGRALPRAGEPAMGRDVARQAVSA